LQTHSKGEYLLSILFYFIHKKGRQKLYHEIHAISENNATYGEWFFLSQLITCKGHPFSTVNYF
jgi:hypothetical protein